MTRRITDPNEIRQALDGFIHNLAGQSASFVVAIRSNEHRPGGIIYEGHRPIAACQTETDRVYTLSTRDSNYSRSVAALKLSHIQYVELLN